MNALPFSTGGHLNPAVTLGFLLSKKVTLMRAVGYWGAQIVGAILGAAFARAVSTAQNRCNEMYFMCTALHQQTLQLLFKELRSWALCQCQGALPPATS